MMGMQKLRLRTRRHAHRLVRAVQGWVPEARLRVLRRLTPVIAVRDSDGDFLVSCDDRGYGQAVALGRPTPDRIVLDRVVALLRQHGLAPIGSAFVDVGAHIGTTTMRAVRRHGFGSSLALEPDPANARLLAANIALNALDGSVVVIETAAGDTIGSAPFARGRSHIGLSTGEGRVGPTGVAAEQDVCTVDVTTLDEALRESQVEADTVGLLWIDAQGSEPAVLRGATSLLELLVPIVFAFRPSLIHSDLPEQFGCLSDAGYDKCVDLRFPAIYAREWKPSIRPISELSLLRPHRSTTTDILVFAARRPAEPSHERL
jgi:FkbM family methyltransferase